MQRITFKDWNEFSPKAYVANGFVGLSFGKDPFTGVGALLSGHYGWMTVKGVESLIPTFAPAEHFFYNDEEVKPEIEEQTYDFSNGELETKAFLTCGGKRVDVLFTVFCSRTSPTIVCSEMKLSSSEPVELKINYTLEYTFKFGDNYKIKDKYQGGGGVDGKLFMRSDLERQAGDAGIAYIVSGADKKSYPHGIECLCEIKLDGKEKVLYEYTSYVPGVMHCEPDNQAQRMAKLAIWNGYERLKELNRKAWAKLWESRVTIEGGDPEWQKVFDASFFYLFSSVSEFAPLSAAPFGLSACGYEGHTFWDTESFMFMPPMLCAPEIARAMLDYRYKRIPAAENNAKLNGYKGIQFPWQSGVSGDEVTVPQVGQAGGAGEQHINLDVALAFDGYARVSGDEPFIREKVWPVMRGVAEWIVSRTDKTERGYEILHVTGIDEENDNVPNDSYTNIMSARILRSASEYSEKLGFGKRNDWIEVADNMFIPSREDGVLPQFEGMPERECQHPTVLMAYFPYGYSDNKENDIKTFEYYIHHKMVNYLCYPMLSGFLGVFPALAGDRDVALYFYELANLSFFADPFYACTEWAIARKDNGNRTPDCELTTSFMTGRGSLLAGLLMGLTKMCPWKGTVDADPSEWLGEDIILPKGWESITIGKMYIRGKAYKVTARQGAKKAVLEEIK